jgi:hypothetical protein
VIVGNHADSRNGRPTGWPTAAEGCQARRLRSTAQPTRVQGRIPTLSSQ